MKAIKFISRFTIICNICFVLFAIFNEVKTKAPSSALPGTVESLPFVKDIIVVLGFPAIVINFLMCLTYCILIILNKGKWVPKYLAFINIGFLFLQVYYFFFFK